MGKFGEPSSRVDSGSISGKRHPSDVIRLVAIAATLLCGLAIGVIAIGSLVTHTRMFSVGIAAVLALYAALVLAVAWLAWRRGVMGLLVATNALHALVTINFALAHQPWFWAATLVPAVGLVAGVVTYARDAKAKASKQEAA